MPSVPFDVQYLILEWVYALSQSEQIDYQILVNCSLVCSTWAPPAQRLLFRRIPSEIISDAPHRSHFVSIPKILSVIRARPLLGTHVRSLAVGGWRYVDHPDPTLLPNAAALLSLCPSIAGIRIASPLDTLAWSPAVEAQLGALAIRPTFLEVEDCAATAHTLLRLWPSIRALRTAWRFCYAHGAAACPTTLRSAHIHGSTSIDYATWVLSLGHDAAALREVDIRWAVWSDKTFARAFVEGAPRGIRSLTTSDMPPPSVLQRLDHLEELIFCVLPQYRPSLPQSIRHVGYHGSEDILKITEPENLWRLVAALWRAPNLRLVSATRLSVNEVLEELEQACRRLNLEWIVYPEPGCFPSAPRGLGLIDALWPTPASVDAYDLL